MATTVPYAKLVAQTQQQTVRAIESGFELAASVLELQKKYFLGLAGILASATPSAQD